MSFSTVPIRKNSQDVIASWWNSLRTAGVLLEQSFDPESNRNFILNSQMTFWQDGLDKLLIRNGGVISAYGADQVLFRNSMDAPAAVRVQRIAGVNTRYAYQTVVEVDVGDLGSWTTFFPIPNRETNQLLNKTVTFRILIKAIANVDQVQVVLRSVTSEAFPGQIDIGSPTDFAINNSTFTEIVYTQAIANEPTNAGMLWVRIRPNSASTGNENDVGNGIIIEQPMLIIGSVGPTKFFPAYKDDASELNALQAFFEKTYNIDTSPATITNIGRTQGVVGDGSSGVNAFYKKTKRATPTVTVYSPLSSTAGLYNDAQTGDQSGSAVNAGQSNFILSTVSSTGAAVFFHFTSDARIF